LRVGRETWVAARDILRKERALDDLKPDIVIIWQHDINVRISPVDAVDKQFVLPSTGGVETKTFSLRR
jgi:hypothetical protein